MVVSLLVATVSKSRAMWVNIEPSQTKLVISPTYLALDLKIRQGANFLKFYSASGLYLDKSFQVYCTTRSVVNVINRHRRLRQTSQTSVLGVLLLVSLAPRWLGFADVFSPHPDLVTSRVSSRSGGRFRSGTPWSPVLAMINPRK